MPHKQCNHDHYGHSHGIGHSHAPANFGRAFAIGIVLNFGFVIIDAGFGDMAHSVALLADAGHNLSDVFGLLLAWGAFALANRRPTERRTYGLRRSSILAALFNAIFFAYRCRCHRLGINNPLEQFRASPWRDSYLVGIIINGATALLFLSGSKGDLNIRGAYLHMAADAAVSAGVVITRFIILFTGWVWLDPVVSLNISAAIVWGTWSLLCDSVNLALDADLRGRFGFT